MNMPLPQTPHSGRGFSYAHRMGIAAAIALGIGAVVTAGILRLEGIGITFRLLHADMHGFAAGDVALGNGPAQLHAPRVRVQFSPFAVSLDRPDAVIVHRADGSWQLPLPSAAQNTASSSPPAAADSPPAWRTLTGALHIGDGRLTIVAPAAQIAAARRVVVDAVNVDASQDRQGRARLQGSLRLGAAAVTFTGARRDDAGFGTLRLRAASVDAAPLIDALVQSPQFIVTAGRLRDVDLRLVEEPGLRGALHPAGAARLDDAAVRLVGLQLPAEHLSGGLDLAEGGLSLRGVHGTLAGVPAALEGGLLPLLPPHLAVQAHVSGAASALRRIAAATQYVDLRGDISAVVSARGPLTQPLVALRIEGTQIAVDGAALTRPAVDATIYGNALDVLDARAVRGDIQAQAGGTIGFTQRRQMFFAGTVAAPGSRVAAALDIDNQGGSAVVWGTSNGGLELAGLGALSPDGRLGSGYASIGPVKGAPSAEGQVRREGDVIAGGGRAQRLALPGFFEELDGRAAAARAGTADVVSADVAVHGIDPAAVTKFVPQIPARFVPGEAFAHVSGASAALALRDAGIVAPALRLEASGVAGRQGGALSGDVDADLTGVVAGLSGRVHGPLAVTVTPAGVRAGSGGLTFQNAAYSGEPLDALFGTVTSAGGHTSVALALQSGPALVRVAGDPAGRIGAAVSGLSLARLHAAPALGEIEGTGWVEGKHGAGGFVSRAGSVRAISAGVLGSLDRSGDAAELTGVSVRLGQAVATLGGDIRLLGAAHTPVYDLRADIRRGELGPLLDAFVPQTAVYEPEGGFNAALRLRGSGGDPALGADVDIPQASFNGAPLRDGAAHLEVDARRARLEEGRIDAGTTVAQFSGGTQPGGWDGRVRARDLDIDFLSNALVPQSNIGGSGDVDIQAAVQGRRLRTSGDVDLHGLYAGDVRIGSAQGQWEMRGPRITGALSGHGRSTSVNITGSVEPWLTPAYGLDPRTRIDAAADVRNVDLASRLALLGVHAPVQGKVNAQARVDGELRRPEAQLHADAHDAALFGLPLTKAEVSAGVQAGRVRIDRAEINAAAFNADAAGTIGSFAPNAPLAINVHFAGGSIRTLLQRIAGRDIPLDGAVSTTAAIGGTLEHPKVTGAAALEKGSLAALPIPEAVTRYGFDGSAFSVSDAEIDLPKGSITAAGDLPLTLSPPAIGPAGAPLALNFGVNNVDLAGLAVILPQQGHLVGMLNGSVALEGTPANPKLLGAVRLDHGALALRPGTTTIDALGATLRFSGTTARLEADAGAGGGTVNLRGRVQVPDLTDIGSADSNTSFRVRLTANNAHLTLPGYGGGTVNGSLRLARDPGTPPAVSGQVALSDALVPPSSFLAASGTPAPAPGGLLGQTTLKIALKVGPDVRLRSGAIDLGALGAAQLGGSIGAPALDGSFAATGGTVTYLNRSFRVQQGRVAFDPADGVDPLIDATAVTTITNPDPSSLRNTTGQATISLNIHGRPNHLVVALTSDPAYSREQILGLLLNAQLVGAVDFGNGGQNTSGGLSTVNQSSGTNPQSSLQTEAVSLLDAQFTQSLLSPLTTAIGGAVGLSDLGLSLGTAGTVGVTASRRLTGNLSLFFEESLGIPTRQSLGINLNPNEATALSFSVYEEQGSSAPGRNGAGSAIYEPGHLNPVSTGVAAGASSNGVSLNLQRRLP